MGGKVFTVEMHHKRIDAGMSGDNIGMNVKNLKKENMPRVGDVMIYAKDGTLKTSDNFSAQVQVLDIPGSIRLATPPSVTSDAVVLHAVLSRSTGRWARTLVARRPRVSSSSRPTMPPRPSSCLSSPLLWTPSRTAMVCPALLSWMATPLSCSVR